MSDCFAMLLSALLLLTTGCASQGQQPQAHVAATEPAPAPTPSPPPSASPSPGPSTSGVEAELKTYHVVAKTRIDLPGGQQTDAWIVRKEDPTQGVVVAIRGHLVVLHDMQPQSDMLVGPWTGPVKVETRDLDGDGMPEILVRGDGGHGPGIWVYRYLDAGPQFDFQGDLHGDAIVESTEPTGNVRFEVVTIQRSKDRQSQSTFWYWKPGGFFQAK